MTQTVQDDCPHLGPEDARDHHLTEWLEGRLAGWIERISLDHPDRPLNQQQSDIPPLP